MSTFAGSGRRAPAKKAFWRNNAFWFVVMPTSLVALVFVLGMITKAMASAPRSAPWPGRAAARLIPLGLRGTKANFPAFAQITRWRRSNNRSVAN